MSEPKYKLGDDGELEEIIDDVDEKPKRKRKPKYYPRTLQIPKVRVYERMCKSE